MKSNVNSQRFTQSHITRNHSQSSLMHFSAGIFLALALFLTGSYPIQSQAKEANPPADNRPGELPPHVAGELIIKFKQGTGKAGKDNVIKANGKIKRNFAKHQFKQHGKDFYDNLVVITLHNNKSMEKVMEALNKNPKVEYAEPNYVVETQAVPNDPEFWRLWAANNTGQSSGTPDADMDLVEAWDITTGNSDIVVAVIDSGVDYTHPDLVDNMWVNAEEIPGNGIDDDLNGYVDDFRGWKWDSDGSYGGDSNDPYDDHYHGTHVAGTIAAVGNNGVGVTGVAWSTRIMPLKFLHPTGVSSSGTLADGLFAVQYATQMGAHVVNNSWGGGGYIQSMQDAITIANDAGMVIIAAAGNSNTSGKLYPAAYDGVIAVAATDHNDRKAWFSSYGAWVDVAAPGEEVYSTMPSGRYDYLSGTSMAAPQVSGLSALLVSMGLSRADAESILVNSADYIDSLNPGYQGLLGKGRINSFDALRSVNDINAPSVLQDLSVTNFGCCFVELNGLPSQDDAKIAGYKVELSTDNITFQEAQTLFGGLPIHVDALSPSTTYYIRVRAIDAAGNLSAPSNVVILTTQANEVPSIVELTGPTDVHVTFGRGFSYAVEGVDADGDRLQYVFDWGDGSTTETALAVSGEVVSADHKWSAEGTYYLSVKAIDEYGAQSAWSLPVIITVGPELPPTVPELAGPTSVRLNDVVDFTVVAYEPNGERVNYQIEWGDGSRWGGDPRANWSGSGEMVTVANSWSALGEYEVKAFSFDDHTYSSGYSIPFMVTVWDDPLSPLQPGKPAGPLRGGIAQSLTFSAMTTDPDVDQIKYIFDWGDGTTSETGFVESGEMVSGTHSWNTLGEYGVRVMAVDSTGHDSVWSFPSQLFIDPNVAPDKPQFISAALEGTVGELLTFTAVTTDFDGDRIKYRFHWADPFGGSWETELLNSGDLGTAAHRWLAPGAYSANVTAIDEGGLHSISDPVFVTITGNVSSPSVVSVTTPVNGYLGQDLEFTAVATDPQDEPVKYVFTFGGDRIETDFNPSGEPVTVKKKFPAEFGFPLMVQAIDMNGNASELSGYHYYSVSVHPAAPAQPLNPVPTNYVTSWPVGEPLTFLSSSTDPEGGKIKYIFDWRDGTTTETGFYDSGQTVYATHTWSAPLRFRGVIVTAIDVDGNVSLGKEASPPTRVEIIENEGTPSQPTLVVVDHPDNGYGAVSGAVVYEALSIEAVSTDPEGEQINYTFAVEDNGYSIFEEKEKEVIESGFVDSGVPATTTLLFERIGRKIVTVKAKDASNNITLWSSNLVIDVGNDPRGPQQPTVPAGPYSAFLGEAVSYVTVTADLGGDQIKYVFEWGDGTTSETPLLASGVEASLSHSWMAHGTYKIRVYAVDSFGNASAISAPRWVTVIANQAPQTPAAPGGPTSGYHGEPLTFSATTIDVEGDAISYLFDWGDGTSTTTAMVASGDVVTESHRWSRIGAYTVTVQAVDVNNNASGVSAPLVVGISDRPPTIPELTGPTSGVVGEALTYTAVSTDSQGESITYWFEWGDGTTSGDQRGPWKASGEPISWEHSWAAAGTYTVRVRAMDQHQYVSDWALMTVTVLLPPPTNITLTTAKVGGGKIHSLAWASVTGATEYRVYRSTSSSGPWGAPHAVVTTPAYGDEVGKDSTSYYYVITAYNTIGESLHSEWISTLGTSEGEPVLAPTSLSANVKKGAVNLRWDANSPMPTAYRVYRSTTSGSGYGQIAEVTGDTTSYKDTSTSAGTTYYYVVTAVDGGESAYSNEVNATP